LSGSFGLVETAEMGDVGSALQRLWIPLGYAHDILQRLHQEV
jgi:hypothetical protein